MNFLALFQGRKEKVSSSKVYSNQDLRGFDLLYHLTYLASISAAGIPRHEIFARAAALPCSTAVYFKKIHLLATTMHYQYAEACRMVGEATDDKVIRGLLLRMSSSLATGESEIDFMSNEAKLQAELYSNEYERRLESLRQWTDAYVALMVSVALIIVVATISAVIYSQGSNYVPWMVSASIFVSIMGCWILFRTAPREGTAIEGDQGFESQRWPRRMFLIFFPLSLLVAAILLAVGGSRGLMLLSVGFLWLPIGVTSASFNSQVERYDEDISSFLRTLGTTAAAMGTTSVEALARMDLRSTNSLNTPATKLKVVLQARFEPSLCWYQFVSNSGSEVIKRGVRVFLDGVSLGGDAEKVGNSAALLTQNVHLLRARRRLVSSTFSWLSLAMHITIVFLLIFIIEVVAGFGVMMNQGDLLSDATGQGLGTSTALSFDFQKTSSLRELMFPVIMILSVVNAVAPMVTEGGYVHKLFYYMGLTTISSGVTLLVAPWLAGSIFNASLT